MSEELLAAPANPLPEGEYAIVECLGHRTMVGRIAEVERFGTKLCSVENVWNEALLPAVFVAGASLYALTPCSRDTAWERRAKQRYELPPSLAATISPTALPSPSRDADGADEYHDEDLYS